ncbi:MAG TPA: SpoIIE family protein phosphatase [Thermoleophilaceae bacterium]|nr:SpoIIE family protein phosphatase [Thermoleophilaceae bacterium]
MSQLPGLFDVRVQARSLAYLFATGATLGLLTLVFPHADEVRDSALIILAATAYVIAAIIWIRADRVREWQIRVVLLAGTVIISLANYYAGPPTLYPLLYMWTALYAFYFFPLREALAQLAFLAVAYAVVLAVQSPDSVIVRWLLAVGTPAVAGLLISRLLGRLDEHARDVQESEERMRLVLDAAPDAFITLDRDGYITNWNSAAERLFGWTEREALGKTMRDLIVPDEFGDRHEERRLALVASEGPFSTTRFDVEFTHRSGSRFPGEATVSKVETGGEVFVSGFIRDVTERLRRQAEREALLREQAARAEAERMAGLVGGMQALVDAALAHRGLDAILRDLVTRVRGVLDAGTATIYLADEAGGLTTGASAPGDHPEGDEFAARVAASREATLGRGDTLVGVPLLAEGEVTAVLVAGAEPSRVFTGEDLTLLRLAAERVGLAIAHARVYEREHRIAETLQRSLLPERLPDLPGLEVAARYLPAASEAEVGGDWYDVIPIAGGAVGLVMGDVAGKGLAGASMVGRLRSALRAYALEGHDAGRVVERLNRLLWTEAEDTQMATMLYVIVDPAASTVRWVNAGHPPPLVVADGEVSFLQGEASVPLGVLPFPTYDETTAPLEPGSSLLLYTDGLVERPGEHLDDGLAQLAARVAEAPQDPQGLLDHLLGTLVPSEGAADDVALLTLHNMPVPDRFAIDFPAEPDALATVRSMLRRWLAHAGADELEVAEIITACGEAATNAIEHAGTGNGARFEVSGSREGRAIEIAIRDSGAWRPEREDDHGRGLELMRTLMDDVAIDPAAEGTTVSLRRTLGQHERAR